MLKHLYKIFDKVQIRCKAIIRSATINLYCLLGYILCKDIKVKLYYLQNKLTRHACITYGRSITNILTLISYIVLNKHEIFATGR